MPKQRSVDLDTARAEYAQWFVKRHYLREKPPHTDGVSAWRRSESRGYIRYYLLEGYGNIEFDEFGDRPYTSAFHPPPERTWFQIDLKDLDSSVHDHHTVVQKYREYRKQAADYNVYQWLLAEAEHHTLVNEAWLRAYGVDVVDD